METLGVLLVVAIAMLFPITCVAFAVSFLTLDKWKWTAATMFISGFVMLWLVGWGFNAFTSEEDGILLTLRDRVSASLPFICIALAESALVVHVVARKLDK